MSDIKTLGVAVANLGDHALCTAGQLMVLTCAVEAIVRTHPDPSAFAAAFRRSWQLAGSIHSDEQAAPQLQEGIDDMLSMLEQACAVDLAVRPPGAA